MCTTLLEVKQLCKQSGTSHGQRLSCNNNFFYFIILLFFLLVLRYIPRTRTRIERREINGMQWM